MKHLSKHEPITLTHSDSIYAYTCAVDIKSCPLLWCMIRGTLKWCPYVLIIYPWLSPILEHAILKGASFAAPALTNVWELCSHYHIQFSVTTIIMAIILWLEEKGNLIYLQVSLYLDKVDAVLCIAHLPNMLNKYTDYLSIVIKSSSGC